MEGIQQVALVAVGEKHSLALQGWQTAPPVSLLAGARSAAGDAFELTSPHLSESSISTADRQVLLSVVDCCCAAVLVLHACSSRLKCLSAAGLLSGMYCLSSSLLLSVPTFVTTCCCNCDGGAASLSSVST